jgi:phage terminase small subunit
MSNKEPAEMNNAPVDTEQVLKDMLEQVTNEVKDGLDDKSVEVAIALDGKINERIDAVFREHWNRTLRNYINTRISEEVAEHATLLGKRLGELQGNRGEL